jgi:hypothetical protein
MLTAQADLSRADLLATRAEKGSYVFQTAVETARKTQAPLVAYLSSQGLSYRSHWIVNALWVRGDMDAVHSLAGRPDVAHIYANPRAG